MKMLSKECENNNLTCFTDVLMKRPDFSHPTSIMVSCIMFIHISDGLIVAGLAIELERVRPIYSSICQQQRAYPPLHPDEFYSILLDEATTFPAMPKSMFNLCSSMLLVSHWRSCGGNKIHSMSHADTINVQCIYGKSL